MSTKIYDGLIATTPNVWETAKRIRSTVEPMFRLKFDEAMEKAKAREGESWKEVFDLYMTGTLSEKWDKPIKYDLWNTPRDMYDLITELRDCPVRTFSGLDFGYTVVLLENGRGRTLPSLVLLYSENYGREYRAALEEGGIVTEYGYWNNTDQPEGVSDREWNQREKAWSFLNVPADEGLSIDLPTKTYFVGEWAYDQIKSLID